MAASEKDIERSAGCALDSLIGTAPCSPPPVQIKDFESLPPDERDAEIVSKEIITRFYERANRQLLKQLREEHELRKRFMPRVFWLVVGVVAATTVLLAAAGTVSACGRVFLSDKVLITLLTATVADIIGIFVIAITWLYPRK